MRNSNGVINEQDAQHETPACESQEQAANVKCEFTISGTATPAEIDSILRKQSYEKRLNLLIFSKISDRAAILCV